MLRKIDSRYIILILVASPVIFVIYYSLKIQDDNYNEIMKSHYTVIGEVVNVRYKVVEVEYEINGKKYIRNDSRQFANIFETEKYTCLVSKINIENVQVEYDKPFIDTVNFDYDTTKPFFYIPFGANEDFELYYSYFVNHDKYKRIQDYELNKVPKNTKNLVVVYRKDTPEIGYLVVDKSKK